MQWVEGVVYFGHASRIRSMRRPSFRRHEPIQLDLPRGGGNGESITMLRTPRQPVVALERERGIGLRLAFSAGDTGLPVTGTLTRRASEEGFTVVAPSPGSCPPPEPVPQDCGTRAYPSDSQVSLAYSTPDSWPYPAETPLTDVLVLSGPNSAAWAAGPPFRNCTSPAPDYLLGGQGGTEPALTFPVSIRSLLARKHFALKRHVSVHLETMPKNLKGVSGTRPVKIETTVSLSFTRLPQAPPGAVRP